MIRSVYYFFTIVPILKLFYMEKCCFVANRTIARVHHFITLQITLFQPGTMNKILNSLLLSSSVIVTVSGNNIDCEYSFCQEAFTSTDCQELATKCAGYGGLPSCNVGDFEFECNDIDLTGSGSTCTTDATALTLCSAYR